MFIVMERACPCHHFRVWVKITAILNTKHDRQRVKKRKQMKVKIEVTVRCRDLFAIYLNFNLLRTTQKVDTGFK